METTASYYTQELESIARDARLFSGKMDDIFAELGERLSTCMHVERVNLWLFNDNAERIECIGNYTNSSGAFTRGEHLHMKDIPEYYKHLKSNKILVVNDVHSSPITGQIAEIYCTKYGITSLLDLPIRIQGQLKGIMCYEHIGAARQWTPDEIQFALAANQIVALAMETTKRRAIQQDLVKAVREKELLLREMHHRIKNNLSVLMSLLRMQGRESQDRHVQSVLSECEARIFSMAKIHEHLYTEENYLTVDLQAYVQQLVEEFQQSMGTEDQAIRCTFDIDEMQMKTDRAINLGLMLMEILNNIGKHAFSDGATRHPEIAVSLKELHDRAVLQVSDNGGGFDIESARNKSLGLTLIEDLAEQIDAEMKLDSSDAGTTYAFRFHL